MKKLLTLFITAALVLCVSSCGKKDEEKSQIVDSPKTVSQPKTDEEINAMRASMQPEESVAPSAQPESAGAQNAQPASGSSSSGASESMPKTASEPAPEPERSCPG